MRPATAAAAAAAVLMLCAVLGALWSPWAVSGYWVEAPAQVAVSAPVAEASIKARGDALAALLMPSADPLASFSRHVSNKRVLVAQADNRLNWLYDDVVNTSAARPPPFVESIAGPSIMSIYQWAHANNFAYLFFSSPMPVMGPRARSALGHYWVKIPAILYLLYLLRNNPAVDFLLFLDTDVAPSHRHSLNDYLQSLVDGYGQARVDGAHVFLNNDDGSYYAALLASAEVYRGKGPINSGSLLLRNSPAAVRLVEKLWYNLTLTMSPFELSYEKTTLHIAWQGVNDSSAAIAAALRAALGPLAKLSDPVIDSVTSKRSSASFVLQPHATDDEASFTEKRRKCCANARACFKGLEGVRGVDIRCVDAKGKSTLYGAWPGDQDRLNWLREMDTSGQFIAARDGAKVLLSSCNVGRHNNVVSHWCNDFWTKLKSAQAEALALGLSNASSPWEPWALFRALVPAMRLPVATDKLPSVQVAQYVVQGKFDLWNVA